MAKKINALQYGIMGAIVGGLNFALSENARRAEEEAMIAKEQRLAALREEAAIRGEDRQNREWDHRNAIEHEQAIEREDRVTARQLAVQEDSQRFQSGEKAKDREHDYSLIGARMNAEGKLVDLRTNAEIGVAEFRERQRRAGVVFDTEYTRRRGPKSGNDPTAGKGIVGSDGKTYKYGEQLPPGVEPKGGYGVSWAPSESKSQAPGSRRRGVGREAITTPTQPTQPTFSAPSGAVQMLKNNPNLRPQFDAKYGQGAAAYYLGE